MFNILKTISKKLKTNSNGISLFRSNAFLKYGQYFAFTLAEVLITITIIGIIAAITVPVIHNKYQKEIMLNQLKKTYSDMQQAISWSIAENGDISSWNFNLKTEDFFNTYLKRYIVIGKDNFNQQRQADNIKYYQISGPEENHFGVMRWTESRYVHLASGAQIFYSNKEVNSDTEYIHKGFFIDVNGYKKPNTFGKDVFVLSLWKYHGLEFYQKNDGEGWEDSRNRTIEQLINGPSNYSNQCNKTGIGSWCGAAIHRNGWKYPDNYPWK